MPFFEKPVSPYREWLARELTTIARQLEHGDVLAVTTTLTSAALWDRAVDVKRAGFASVLATRLEVALEQARQDGELSGSTAGRDATAAVLGPIVYRALIEHAPADRTLVERCVQAAGAWTT